MKCRVLCPVRIERFRLRNYSPNARSRSPPPNGGHFACQNSFVRKNGPERIEFFALLYSALPLLSHGHDRCPFQHRKNISMCTCLFNSGVFKGCEMSEVAFPRSIGFRICNLPIYISLSNYLKRAMCYRTVSRFFLQCNVASRELFEA